ncbi:MAG: ATP-binding protein [Magnetospiraceae bacterium]
MPESAKPLMTFRLPAKPARLKLLRGSLRGLLRCLGCGEGEQDDIVRAVDEACQNIIRHGYQGADGEIEVMLSLAGTVLEIRLRDYAPTLDMAAVTTRDLAEIRPGGLGVYFMRSCMDSVDFKPGRDGVGNELIMRKTIERGAFRP